MVKVIDYIEVNIVFSKQLTRGCYGVEPRLKRTASVRRETQGKAEKGVIF
jgi:hypothetical protein